MRVAGIAWVGAAVVLWGVAPAEGQSPARRPQAKTAPRDAFAALRSDSAAWQHVLVYVIQSLSPSLVRAAADSASQPWEIRLPPTEPQRRLLEAQLRTVLRARPILPTDSVTHQLEIGALRIVNDTALVGVEMQETRRCAGTTRTTGYGRLDTVGVARDPKLGFWGAAFPLRGLIGDRVGC